MEIITPTTRERNRSRPATWVVRDDGAGSLAAALTAEVGFAQRLLQAAELVNDSAGYQHWRHRHAQWRERCGATLRQRFEREAAAEFFRGTELGDFSREQWRDARRAAVNALENMIELLVTLRHTLAGQGGGSRRRAGHGDER
jgi:hypothetical protein